MQKNRILGFMLLPLLCLCFLSVMLLSTAQVDTSILSVSGKDWNLKVDSTLQSALDSQNVPYTSIGKAGLEKELFLTLNSLKDCQAGMVQFKVSTYGLTVYKQLPLNIELKVGEQYDFINSTHAMLKDKTVVYRPENVVNSFACFDSSGAKVLHIYASKLIDAKGNSVWVDSDLKDGLLTVYLDSKFLETAVFPVTLDPTFGYTSIGGSATSEQNWIYGTKYTVATTAYTTNINIYCAGNGGGVQGAIYDSSGNLIAISAIGNAGSAGWVQLALETTLSSGDYYLVENSNSSTYAFYFDWGSYDGCSKSNTFNNGFPASITGLPSATDKHFSIYINYDEAEPTPTPTPTPTPSPSPSPSPTPTSTPTINAATSGNLDLTLYLALTAIIGALAVLAYKYWSILGVFGGLLGAILSYICLTSPYLILQSVWNETGQVWVQQLYPMGFFAYVPIVLMALCFVVALKK
jgi:hypothetical protein